MYEWLGKDPSFLHADSNDTVQTGLTLTGQSFCWFCHDTAQIMLPNAYT